MMVKRSWIWIVAGAILSTGVLAAFLLKAQVPQPQSDPSAALARSVGPYFQKNCESCHNASLPSGQVDFQQLLATPNSLRDRLSNWQDVAFQIRSGQMPPKGFPRPNKADSDAALEMISRAIAATPSPASGGAPAPPILKTRDWLTYGYDPERTGWDRGESEITKATVPHLHLLWKLQTPIQPDLVNRYSTMTEAVAIDDVSTPDGKRNLVYVGGRDDTVYAIDADKGTVFWTRSFPNPEKPPVAPSGNCPENMNATPVVDREKGILYFLPTDGRLRGISLADGADRFPATQFVPQYSRNFSLNLVDGWIVTGTTRGCANAISQAVFIDVNDPAHPVTHFFTSPGKGSGAWGRGGTVSTPFGWLMQTADGAYDPASGRWGNSILSFSRTGLLVDSFTPPDEAHINARDLDLGSSSPVVFPFGDRTLVAAAGKQGVIYLLDAKNLGGADHRTALYTSPRWSNDTELFGFGGMWSVMTTYMDSFGKRWLLAPFYGPPAKETMGMFKKTHGSTVNGQLMAFTVEGTSGHPRLQPQWMSADLDLPGITVVANNVVLILADGDRASTLLPEKVRRPGGQSTTSNLPPLLGVDPKTPGYERDETWESSQFRPFEEGGQQHGDRFQGGRETTHAILYALDPDTGDEIYSSADAMDSWNHYGEFTLSNGKLYVTSYDGRIFAFGLSPSQSASR
jgi:outer membrane protein assembly factor BamB